MLKNKVLCRKYVPENNINSHIYVPTLTVPRAEYSIEGIINERKLWVSYEGSNFSFLSAKSASVPEELPPKGVKQTSQHKYQGLFLVYQQDGRIPREAPSL